MLDARRHVICTPSHVVRSLVLYAEILRSLANQELVLLSYCRCDRPHLTEGYLSTDPYSANIGTLTVELASLSTASACGRGVASIAFD